MTAAHHFGNVVGLILGVARVHALRGEAEKEVAAHFETGLGQHGQQQFVCGAGIGGGFQNYEHARVEVLDDFLARRHDVTHVGVFGLAQGRGHADVDGVEIADHRKIGGGDDFACLHQFAESGRGDIADVGFPGVDAPSFSFADVDSGYRETSLGELHGQRKAYVAQSDDPDARLAGLNFLFERSRGRRGFHACLSHPSSFSHRKYWPLPIKAAGPVR